MAYLPMKLPPGVLRAGTEYTARGRWYDSHLVRWYDGKVMGPVGGWQAKSTTAVSGKARAIITWKANDGTRRAAIGTTTKLQAMTSAGALSNITPAADSGTLGTDPFAVVDTDATVTVTHTSHGRAVGDIVTFSGATAGGGITVDGEYAVATVLDANTYTIEHSSAATLTDATTGGAAVAYIYDIDLGGDEDASIKRGYGIGLYGNGTYGTVRPDSGNPTPASVWDLDIWGQYLVGCLHGDGTLYEWQNSGRAATITNAPTSCYGLVVHPKRLLIALGAGGNPRKFQWSTVGDNTVWTPSATNQAGSDEIQQGQLICGRAIGDQVLMLSDQDAHAVDYLGLPYVLRARHVGEACGAISKGCLVSAGSFAAWWSKSGFWLYDGAVRPLRCDVWDDLRKTLTVAQQSKVTGFHNAKNQEIWWFYPRSGNEVSHYILWSYRYDYWAVGELTRLSGCAPATFESPLCVGSDGYVYEHELGQSYTGVDMPFARGGPVELGNGDRTMHVLAIVPDEATAGDVSVSFRTRQYPSGAERVLGTTTLTSAGKADVRFNARQVELVVTGAQSANWRFGDSRLDVRQGGKR